MVLKLWVLKPVLLIESNNGVEELPLACAGQVIEVTELFSAAVTIASRLKIGKM
jgi:hypothetical protein